LKKSSKEGDLEDEEILKLLLQNKVLKELLKDKLLEDAIKEYCSEHPEECDLDK
jgi:hypothetical protein